MGAGILSSTYHTAVLAEQCIDALDINPDGIYVDANFGGGGHSRLILEKLGKNGRLIAFDQDEYAHSNAPDDSRILTIQGNFRYLPNYLRYLKIEKINGLLADLGVSSYHFDNAGRGFAFRLDGPLDMRMNAKATQTAADILNNYKTEQLTEIFRQYGEIEHAARLANAIVNAREIKKLKTTGDLKQAIVKYIPKNSENKYLARVFQAIRIEVNDEITSLKKMLESLSGLIIPGGKLVIITYHSLEDRLVKNFIRYGNFEGTNQSDLFGNRERKFEPLYKNVITPAQDELEANPRSRSAKMRAAVKL